MKKILLLALSLPVLSFAQWTENFDSSGNLPAGWAAINGWTVTNYDGSCESQPNLVMGQTGGAYFVTKAINVQAGISDGISFYTSHNGLGNFDYCEVLLSTTNQSAAAFTHVLENNLQVPYNWTKSTFNLSAYVGQTVYIAIKTKPTVGEIWLDSFTVTSASLLSASEVSTHKEKISLSPNPFTETLHLSDLAHIQAVSVSDSSGKLVKSVDHLSSDIQLEDLKPGMYLVTLYLKDGSRQTIKALKK